MPKPSFVNRLAAAAILLSAGTLLPAGAAAQTAMQPGEAFVTRFSGTSTQGGQTLIDVQGPVGSIIDLRSPSAPPQGQHEQSAPKRPAVTAEQIGQVFGVALDDAASPNVYLTATSTFGLHRGSGNGGWMPGMWGQGGGPGTVYRLDAANGLSPNVFARIMLSGRPNSGAALGNIAYDRWHKQFYVSDLETGMIHRLRLSDGMDLGHYDHGMAGRTGFYDVPSGRLVPLPAVPFDPAKAARVNDCPGGDFARTPSCWNFADFRRRVWGLAVRHDSANEVRLYYAIWGSEGFGNPDFANAGDDKRNAVWSLRIGDDGSFDLTSVRREFFLPDFFRSPEDIARFGHSQPVTDIAFPAFGDQAVMLVAERGGVRNLGLGAQDAFARPNESRVLRYELTEQGFWRLAGRYDVGVSDRKDIGPPFIRATATGGVSFGMGYDDEGRIDPANPDAFVWMSGGNLCSASGPCVDPQSGQRSDTTQVNGLEGRPAQPYDAAEPFNAFDPYPQSGTPTPLTGPDHSYMIDAFNGGNAAWLGDVQVFQTEAPAVSEAAPAAPGVEEVAPGVEALPEGLYEEEWGWEPAPLPPDGWPLPPPEHLDTDLAIEKSGPAQCQWGVNCAYTVTVRNAGSAAYNGPLAVNDTMPDGATLTSSSPGWHCDVAGGVVRCRTLGDATLAVGATATLHLTVLLPAAGGGAAVQNCAAIDWPEMGTDDGPGDGNDHACIETPVAQGFDLGLQKDGPPQCAENADCMFHITVTNHGPGEFNGVLAVHDQLPPNATMVGNSVSWSCSQTGGEVECQQPGVTLPVGATRTLALRARLPDGIAGGTAENCARINWAAIGADDGAGDAHVDEDCHTVNVIDNAGFFDLSVTKVGPAHCNAGGDCAYTWTVTNHGPDDYTGGLSLTDNPPAGAIRSGGPVGTICALAFPGAPFTCSLLGPPMTLHPGESRGFDVTIRLPDPVAGDTVMNCINLNWGGAGMPADDNPPPGGGGERFDADCIQTNVGAGFDIEVAKAGPAECYEGHICEYTVRLTNHGPRAYHGYLAFDDVLPAGGMLESATGAWSCRELGAPGTVSCNISSLIVPAGEIRTVTLRVRLPDPVAGDTVTNCASLRWAPMPAGFLGPEYTGDDNAATDGPACVTTPVLAADLAPFGATACERGATCQLDVRIENRGGRLFRGKAGLRGTLDPAVTISSISSQTRGLDCRVTGQGRYECQADALSLKPGAAAQLQLSIAIPVDFPHDRITHRKEMLWPDLNVKDRKPQNDRHTSTIEIEQPEQQVAAPERPPQGPDLLVKKRGPAVCQAGKVCRYTIDVVNNGPGTYRGTVWVHDAYPGYIFSTLVSTSAGWACTDFSGAVDCRRDVVTLRAGESITLEIAVRLADNILNDMETRAGGGARNCAWIRWPGEYLSDERSRTLWVEWTLAALGYLKPRDIDGDIGVNERKAIRVYQAEHGLTPTGNIDNALWDSMFPVSGRMPGDRDSDNDRRCIVTPVVEIPPAVEPSPEVPPAPPPPARICAGGQIRAGECICPPNALRKQTAPNEYACVLPPTVPPPAPPPQVQPVPPVVVPQAPPPGIRQCIGGRLVRGRCLCPSGTTSQQTGPRTITCIRPQRPPVTCGGGVVRNGACICPSGTARRQQGPNNFVCVKTPSGPPLVCNGGQVRRGQCICPKGTNRRQDGRNAYTCVAPPPPSITCAGGRVSRGRCICPGGTTRQQMGPNAYKCVQKAPPPPSITCAGGRVSRGRCICPGGTTRQQMGLNAYKCVQKAPPPPSITCAGGRVSRGRCICPKGTTRRQTGSNAYRCVRQLPSSAPDIRQRTIKPVRPLTPRLKLQTPTLR